jgi:hypothetical protein
MKRSSTVLVLSAILGASAIAAVACKPAHAPAGGAEGDGGAQETGDGGASAQAEDAGPPVEGTEGIAADGGTSPLASVLMTDPAEVQRIFEAAGASPKAALKPNGAAGATALAKGLRELAKVAAPGMKADGPLATGKLDEKKSSQTDITLKPGKCYAVVGFATKITDLDLYLFLAPGILSGQDTTDDDKPVIGRAPDAMCPVAKTAIKYKLGIVADHGSGEFAVQLYSKDMAEKVEKGPKKKGK